jgi:hypothetical protein
MMSWIRRKLDKLLNSSEKARKEALRAHRLQILKTEIRHRLHTKDYLPLPFPNESKPSLWFWSI